MNTPKTVGKISRRKFLGIGAAAAGTAALAACANPAAPTAAPAKPASGGSQAAKPEINVWQVTLEQPIDIANYDSFFDYFDKSYPNYKLNKEYIGYNDMLDKTRVAVRGGGGPHVATMPILWGVEFAANKLLKPLKPQDLGYTNDTFWPKALNSCKWDGETYGVPTNNECMAMIINKELFAKVKADPEKGPQTWDEVAEISKKMKMDLGIAGFGMVARLNAGNTPFRFMPTAWAFGGGALDEAEDNPNMKTIMINSKGTRDALALYKRMYVDDKSVPNAALDNTQTENQELFLNEKIAMMISHPSEYATIVNKKPDIAAKMQYVLIPSGPKRRAAVYGGSNIHIFKNTPDAVMPAVLDYVKLRTNPEWSNRLAWFSNPGNRDGFKNSYFELRKSQTKFLDVTTKMLDFGIPFPVIPEATEIMNLIVPTMIHNALTGKMTVEAATDDAAKKIDELFKRRK
jgi:multiple sugar transport system substrate-binding protein